MKKFRLSLNASLKRRTCSDVIDNILQYRVIKLFNCVVSIKKKETFASYHLQDYFPATKIERAIISAMAGFISVSNKNKKFHQINMKEYIFASFFANVESHSSEHLIKTRRLCCNFLNYYVVMYTFKRIPHFIFMELLLFPLFII